MSVITIRKLSAARVSCTWRLSAARGWSNALFPEFVMHLSTSGCGLALARELQ
jgi:hypothetical protein